jgi:hypothetical protein
VVIGVLLLVGMILFLLAQPAVAFADSAAPGTPGYHYGVSGWALAPLILLGPIVVLVILPIALGIFFLRRIARANTPADPQRVRKADV